MMMSAFSPMLILWGIGIMTGVLFFWGFLRFALSTCDADNTTYGLAFLCCLLMLLAGLALGVMLVNLSAH
jgi:hypothetical protein